VLRRSFVRPALAVAAVGALGLTATACDTVTPYAARYNGTTLTRSDFESELRALAGKDAVGGAATIGAFTKSLNDATAKPIDVAAGLSAQILTIFVEAEATHAVYLSRGLDKTAPANLTQANDAFQQQSPDLYDAVPKRLRDDLIRLQAESASLSATLATPEKLRAAYDANPGAYDLVCISHILVNDLSKAQAIKAQLDSGADFAQLAAANSIDTGSAPNGGRVPAQSGDCWVASDIGTGLVPEFADAALAAPVNKVTDPVKSQFGYHLIKVTSRRPQTFDQARQQVAAQLGQSAQQDVATLVQGELAHANISIGSRYGAWSAEQGQVIPPAGAYSTQSSLPPELQQQQQEPQG
jgi:parvulin-like peptidyl-prolyl isomerase